MVGWSGYTHSISGFTGPLMSVTEYERKTVLHVNMIDDKPYDVSVMIKTPTNIALTPGDTVTAVGKFEFPEDTLEFASEKNLWHR